MKGEAMEEIHDMSLYEFSLNESASSTLDFIKRNMVKLEGSRYWDFDLKIGIEPPSVGDVIDSEEFGRVVVSSVMSPEDMIEGRGFAGC